MPDANLETFVNELDKAMNEALRQGVDAEYLERELQKRAQDMRERAADDR